MPKLTVDLRTNETLTIGEARVRLERKSGQLARLVIEAPANTRVSLPARPTHESAEQALQGSGNA